MKRILMILLCCLLLTACGQQENAPTDKSTEPSVTDTSTQALTEANLQSFILYRGDENAENFLSQEVQVPEINETVITEHLISAGVLPEGTAVDQFELEGTQLNIDLNDTFLDHLYTMGTAGERILVGSVVNTFLSAYDAETVFLTVNGEIIESGHVIYDFPLEFFT